MRFAINLQSGTTVLLPPIWPRQADRTPQAAVRWISASWWLRTAPQSSTRAGHDERHPLCGSRRWRFGFRSPPTARTTAPVVAGFLGMGAEDKKDSGGGLPLALDSPGGEGTLQRR